MRNPLRILILMLVSSAADAAEPSFPEECPRKGSMDVVSNPSEWADRCFQAITGRLPSYAGEAASVNRDIDLDGVSELLEIRGTGQAMKQIYVFRESEAGLLYMGELNAHPSFEVVSDDDSVVTIKFVHRFGADEYEEKRIQYVNNEFVEVAPRSAP